MKRVPNAYEIQCGVDLGNIFDYVFVLAYAGTD